jgi:hypothetical protein
VDGVIKKRKDACTHLNWEITDLQNQLDYVEKTTEQYADNFGAQNAALSWTKQQFNCLKLQHELIRKNYLKPIEELISEIQSIMNLGNCQIV